MKRFILLTKIRLYALSKVFSINIGSKVKYKRQLYEVCNGVRPDSWRLEPSKQLPDDGWIKREDCKKVLSLWDIAQSYRFHVSFYKSYWLDIWCNVRPRRKGEWY